MMKKFARVPWPSRRLLVGLMLVGLVSISNALAAATPPIHPIYDRSRDYVLAEHVPKIQRIQMIDACDPCWGGRVVFTPFADESAPYAALRYDGRKITLLLPEENPRADRVTPARLRTLVDRLDLLYEAYARLLDWEPAKISDPNGRHVLAVVPEDPWWYGLAFAPGDVSLFANGVLDELALDDDLLSNVWVHEVGHNFDPIGAWDYGPDPAHDWTAILQTLVARHFAHWSDVNRTSADAFFQQFLGQHWSPFVRDPELTWELCAATVPRPAVCQDKNAFMLAGGLIVRLGPFLEPAAFRDWVRVGLAETQAGPPAATPGERSDRALAALVEVTRTSLSCVVDRFDLHEGNELRIANQRYAEEFPGCRDSDGDGEVAFDDCDDSDASVFPGAAEVADGVDNDCNGLIDEQRLVEQSDWPDSVFPDTAAIPRLDAERAHVIEGELGPDDRIDGFRFTELLAEDLQVEVCADGPVVGLATITPVVGIGWFAYNNGLGCVGPTVLPYLIEWGRNLGFQVQIPDEGAGTAGTYEVRLAPRSTAWAERPLARPTRSGERELSLDFDPDRVAEAPSARLLWTVSGLGEVAAGPIAAPESWTVELQPGWWSGDRDRLVRVHRVLDDLPMGEPSPPYLLSSDDPGRIHPITAATSGGWYSPDFDGEGYVLEVLSDDRAILYWFTYHPRAWNSNPDARPQYWMFADLAIDGATMRGDLLGLVGGRPGRALDPSAIDTRTVGTIEFTYTGDSTGLVHYDVDGRSGEYAIQRLHRASASTGSRGLGGSWYDPAFSGQGLVVHENTAASTVVYLFTYDEQGTPTWRISVGDWSDGAGSSTFRHAAIGTEGGLLGRGFRPDDVARFNDGELRLQLDCATGGSFDADLPALGSADWSLDLQRLTTLLGSSCP